MNLNIHSAVRRCAEMGFAEEDVVITAILPDAFGGGDISVISANNTFTGYDIYKRYKEVQNYKSIMDDLLHAYSLELLHLRPLCRVYITTNIAFPFQVHDIQSTEMENTT